MKRLYLILMIVLCLVFTDQAYAQRSLPGMRGIQLTGGMVDGIYSSKNDNEAGYYFGVAMATYAKNGNKWVFGAEYLERYYPYRERRLPIVQFTAEGGYYYNFLTDPSKTVFILFIIVFVYFVRQKRLCLLVDYKFDSYTELSMKMPRRVAPEDAFSPCNE